MSHRAAVIASLAITLLLAVTLLVGQGRLLPREPAPVATSVDTRNASTREPLGLSDRPTGSTARTP